MGIKSVPVKLFREFLKHIGCEHVRTKGGHELWYKKDGSLLRPITIQTHVKDVPVIHIHTNLKTLGMSHNEFEQIINNLK